MVLFGPLVSGEVSDQVYLIGTARCVYLERNSGLSGRPVHPFWRRSAEMPSTEQNDHGADGGQLSEAAHELP